MKTKELKYRIIQESNGLGEKKYYVQVYRENGNWFFNKFDWVYERETVYDRFSFQKVRIFSTYEEAYNHVQSMSRTIFITIEGTIQRDVL